MVHGAQFQIPYRTDLVRCLVWTGRDTSSYDDWKVVVSPFGQKPCEIRKLQVRLTYQLISSCWGGHGAEAQACGAENILKTGKLSSKYTRLPGPDGIANDLRAFLAPLGFASSSCLMVQYRESRPLRVPEEEANCRRHAHDDTPSLFKERESEQVR